MRKFEFRMLEDAEYLGIITVLDYEINLSSCLANLTFPDYHIGKRVLVDSALKTGVDEFRFNIFPIGNDGKIILNSHQYVTVPEKIEKTANYFLRLNGNIVRNSILTEEQKRRILD